MLLNSLKKIQKYAGINNNMWISLKNNFKGELQSKCDGELVKLTLFCLKIWAGLYQ